MNAGQTRPMVSFIQSMQQRYDIDMTFQVELTPIAVVLEKADGI